MKKYAIIFLQIVTVLVGLGALFLLLWEPHTEGVNAHAKFFAVYLDPFVLLMYAGSIVFFTALYQVFKLLGLARGNEIFSPKATKSLRTIKHCAMTIICFIFVEEIFIMLNHKNDDPSGGVFMGVVITFVSLIVIAVTMIFESILGKSSIDGSK